MRQKNATKRKLRYPHGLLPLGVDDGLLPLGDTAELLPLRAMDDP